MLNSYAEELAQAPYHLSGERKYFSKCNLYNCHCLNRMKMGIIHVELRLRARIKETSLLLLFYIFYEDKF